MATFMLWMLVGSLVRNQDVECGRLNDLRFQKLLNDASLDTSSAYAESSAEELAMEREMRATTVASL